MPESFPDNEAIRQIQLKSVNDLLRQVVPANPFYTKKFLESSTAREFASLDEFEKQCPFTTKHELAHDQQHHPLYGRNLTFPIKRYSRYHQTSVTSGKPLRWLDTPE